MDRRSQRELAARLRETGQVGEAETIYRALLREDPRDWQGLADLGLCARLRQDLTAAGGHLGAALAAAPAPSPRWLRQVFAATLREQDRVDEAEAVYHALLRDVPGDWQGLAGLGLCARQRRRRAGCG